MSHAVKVFLFTFGLFLGMLLFLELGRRIGIRRVKEDSQAASEGVGAVDAAVFALLGLLIAFTFSGASSRFDMRRQLIVEETNDIGTAYLRLDLLPADVQPALRESFRRYLNARIEIYRKLPDLVAAKEQLAKAIELQTQIWRQAVVASRSKDASPSAPILLLPALNAMIDITTTRTMAAHFHPPTIIFVMLITLALAAALLAGHGMAAAKTRSWVHVVGFAAATAVALAVILEIEFPRVGFIRVADFDRVLVELRDSMK